CRQDGRADPCPRHPSPTACSSAPESSLLHSSAGALTTTAPRQSSDGQGLPAGSLLTLLTADHRVWSSRASAGANTPRTRHSTGGDPSMGAAPSTGSDPSMEADPSTGADELDGRRAGDAAQWVGAAYP